LGRTLESLSGLDEVIVYENGSTDRTPEIAQAFDNVVLRSGAFQGFGPTKNLAARLARNDWILSIDSDEVARPELLEGIAALELADPETVYEIRRENYFLGEKVEHSDWGNDWLLRLYNRNTNGYNDEIVHENIVPAPGTAIIRLNGSIEHQAVTDMTQFLVKINRYSELRARSGAKAYGPVVTLLKTFWAFFRTYVLYLGFLDGWRGVVIAYSNATGVFYRCMMCYTRDNVASPSSSLHNDNSG